MVCKYCAGVKADVSVLLTLVGELQETSEAIRKRLNSLEQCLNCTAPAPPPVSPSPSPPPIPPPVPPPPTRPPLPANNLRQTAASSGSVTITWNVTDVGNILRQTGFCVSLGGTCTDTVIGTVETSSSALEDTFSFKGLTKNTSYSCYIVEINNIGSTCSSPLTVTTKETITEFYRPLGVTMYPATDGPAVWVTDQQLSQLTYCTANPSTYELLGCSLFDGVGLLAGPVGIAQYNASNAFAGPVVVVANPATGYFATYGLDDRTGYFEYLNGLSSIKFDNSFDIVIDYSTDYAYSMEYQGVGQEYKVVKMSMDQFGSPDALLSTSSQTFNNLRGLALDTTSSPKRMYLTDTSLIGICDLDGSGDLTNCRTSSATFGVVDTGRNLIVDTSSATKHLYVSHIKGVAKCDINNADGSLSNCVPTGPFTCCTPGPDYAQPYGLYIIPSTPRKMYVTGSYNQKVYVCDISSSDGSLVNCVASM